jgi:hypothetical protein
VASIDGDNQQSRREINGRMCLDAVGRAGGSRRIIADLRECHRFEE